MREGTSVKGGKTKSSEVTGRIINTDSGRKAHKGAERDKCHGGCMGGGT